MKFNKNSNEININKKLENILNKFNKLDLKQEKKSLLTIYLDEFFV